MEIANEVIPEQVKIEQEVEIESLEVDMAQEEEPEVFSRTM